MFGFALLFGVMIDLHCHILPGIDDGAPDLATSLRMARAFVADGVHTVACTPHILPGVYHNTGPGILQAVESLREALARESIPLNLIAGADVHIAPDFVGGLKSGKLLSLGSSRYVLVEPPHHVAPPRLDAGRCREGILRVEVHSRACWSSAALSLGLIC